MDDRPPFPPKPETTIQFAHTAYALAERFAARGTGIDHFQTWTPDDTLKRAGEADVLVASGFWRPELLDHAARLRFIQVPAVGYENFDLEALAGRGIRLANGAGVNKNAVSEHAMALILAFTRQLHTARDNQRQRHWRGMQGDIARREEELGGRTLLIYGLGDIGARLARLARAFDMRVLGIKRDLADHDGSAHELHPPDAFLELLPGADFVVLTCPLTPETAGLIDARALGAMSPSSRLINVARGGCVDEDALISALERGGIAGAGIDTTAVEPLPESSRLWQFDNVIVTPHTGGETRAYEENVIDLLLENLERLWRGRDPLVNQKA
ncbi:MAG: D-2-hydroxyacid dehydrogenase [Hyphomicrobiales bacterium]